MKKIFLFSFLILFFNLIYGQDHTYLLLNGNTIVGKFYDSTKLKNYIDSISGGGVNIYNSVTKHQADSLIIANSLVKGAFYKIINADTITYNNASRGTDIILQADSSNHFSPNGVGLFYNPKYDQTISGFGIWSNRSTWTTTLTSVTNFNGNELITGNGGQTGQLFTNLDANIFIAITGDWTTVTSITGNVSGATATVTGIVLQSYAIGAKAIWGGYSWSNLTGAVGTATNVLVLDNTNWSKDGYDTTNYNLKIDEISYDYTHALIVRRYDESNNLLVETSYENSINEWIGDYGYSAIPISAEQWGNNYNYITGKGTGWKKIIDSYDESVNFSGSYQNYLTFNSGSYQENLTFSDNSYQNYLTFSDNSSQNNLTFSGNSFQNYLTFSGNSSQNYPTFSGGSYQNSLTFNGSYQNYLTFSDNSSQNSLTFNGSYQNYLTFSGSSSQNSLTFNGGSSQVFLTFSGNSYQNYLTFSGGSFQDYLTFNGSSQNYLTFSGFSSQISLTSSLYTQQAITLDNYQWNRGSITLAANEFNIYINGDSILATSITTGSLTATGAISLTAGANKSVGTATLNSGTVIVSNTRVTSSSLIYLTYNTPSGTLASGLSAPTASIINGTSFVINSLTTAGVVNTLDNSTVNWIIIN